jgi:uncharacterized membrane protein YciS (DUF1049 family)
MRLIKWLLVLAIFLGVQYYGIEFARHNAQTLNLVFPFGRETGEIELWQLVFFSVGAGAGLALLVLLVEVIGLQAGKQRLSRRVKQLERELTSMRNLPLSENVAADRPAIEGPASSPASASAATPAPRAQSGDIPSI